MPYTVKRLDVPLVTSQVFHLDTGDSVTIQAKQASSAKNLRRAEELKGMWQPGEEGELYRVEIIPPILRQMVDAFCADLEADIVDENGEPVFVEGLTIAQYRNVWGLQELDMPVMAWKPAEGPQEEHKYTIRDMIMEVIYRANPLWDPFRDDETGETLRPLREYGKKDSK